MISPYQNRFSYAVLLICLAMGLAACQGCGPGNVLTPSLATDFLVLEFARPGNEAPYKERTALLFLESDQTSATIESIELEGSQAFRLLSQFKPPFQIKGGKPNGVKIEIGLTPGDSSLHEGLVRIRCSSCLHRENGEYTYIKLRYSPSEPNASPQIELVPRYPTCTDDASCRKIDPRLSCVDDAFSGTSLCRTSSPRLPLLMFPLTTQGKVTKRTFWIRNTGGSPLTIDDIRFDDTSSKDFKFSSTGLNLPLILASKAQKEVTVDYSPSDGSADVGKIIVSSNATETPRSELLVEASTRGCDIGVQPRRLSFVGPSNKQVTIFNGGNEACTVHKVYLKSGKTDIFAILPPQAPSQILAPNGSISFLVKFAPLGTSKVVEFLVVESDDPDEPVIEIEFDTTGNEQPPCQILATPSTLNYGLVPVGRRRLASVIISNKGYADCEITSIYTSGTNPSANTAFQHVSTLNPPVKIAAGGKLQLDVAYTPPAERAGYEGRLVIASNDTVQPNYEVKLLGSSGTLCLEVVPPALDFGATKFGCATPKRSIEVFHLGDPKCAANVSVVGIQLAQHAGGEFRMNSAPTVPRTLTAGQSIRIELSYKAKDLGVDTATLEIANSTPGQSPIPVALVGEGVSTLDQKDVFKQLRQPLVDLAFIVDNSCSMADVQASLGANFQSLINWAIRINVDYQILVTTTDVTAPDAGCAQGATKIITNNSPDPSAAFAANVKVGTNGSAVRQGLEAAYKMLTLPASTGCNKGFVRPNAALSLVFVSNEPDSSPRPVSFYVGFFKSLKGPFEMNLVRASAIVGPVPGGCANGQTKASPAPRYWDAAKELHGVQASICDSWSAAMSSIGSLSFGFQTQFFLSRQADATTIVVKVNGNTIKEDAASGWQYDATSNAINFGSSAIPAPGATIEITYKAACLP